MTVSKQNSITTLNRTFEKVVRNFIVKTSQRHELNRRHNKLILSL